MPTRKPAAPEPPATPLPADPNGMILGEMRGQLREMVHSVNNLSTKFDALTREVIGLGTMAADIGELKAKVAQLETEKNQRDGATGVLSVILKSPAIGWLVGAAVSAWAVLTGRVHI